MFDFDGKTALVTGASRGIGLAIALAFKKHGAKVHITGTRESADAYSNDLSGLEYHSADLSSTEGRQALVSSVPDIDVLINNVGVSAAEEFDIDSFRSVIETNVVGTMEMCTLYKDVLASNSGVIVNIGSVVSFLSLKDQPGYTASKGAIVSLTRALADKWARLGIRVNMIAPGFIHTKATEGMRENKNFEEDMLATVPMKRWGQPSEIAGSALFLASPFASYITGTSVIVDGGMMIR